MSWRDIVLKEKDMEKRMGLTGYRCKSENCLAKVSKDGEICQKCQTKANKPKARSVFTR